MPETTRISESIWITRVNIRPFEKRDLPALEWEGEYIRFRRLYAEIYQSVEAGRALMWVAELTSTKAVFSKFSMAKAGRREIVGQVFVQLLSNRIELADGVNRAYIYGFRIKPAYRGNGLGTRMLQVIENDLIQRKFKTVSLNVSQENFDARRLYENLGYNMIGLDPGIWSYIDHRGLRQEVQEPAWRMEKVLFGAELIIESTTTR